MPDDRRGAFENRAATRPVAGGSHHADTGAHIALTDRNFQRGTGGTDDRFPAQRRELFPLVAGLIDDLFV